MNLKDKVAFVTGSVRGIGRETTLALARYGAHVVINYRPHHQNKELAEALKKECEDLGVKALLVAGDIASSEDNKRMFEEIKTSYGRLDILVNNAGITRDKLLIRMKEEDFDEVINVNLKGTYLCMKNASSMMMKQKYGRIISLSSVVGVMGNAGQVNYSASKAGIIGMTKSLARELGARGITVNAVAPGFIRTDMTDTLNEKVVTEMLTRIPLKAFGEAADVAEAICFLASDEAKYITGHVLHVDGGMAM